MPKIPGLRRFFRVDRGASSVERAVDDELQFHFDRTIEELIAAGRTPDAARREAELRFGDRLAARERLTAIDRSRVENERRAEWWDSLRQDVKYAARGLRMKPGFTAAVVVTLGLGIGANSAMFGVIDRLLFRPPTYLADAGRVNRVWIGRTYDNVERFTTNTQYRRYQDFRRWTTKFDRMATFYFESQAIVGEGQDARQGVVGGVSASYFAFFDARPERGRWFTATEDTTASPALVTVLGYGYWQNQFGGREDILGQQVQIGQSRVEVVGIAPPGMGTLEGTPVDAFIPITLMGQGSLGGPNASMYYATYYQSWVEIIAHRAPGVTDEEATADLTSAFQRSYRAQMDIQPRMLPIESVKPRALAMSSLRQRGPQPGSDARLATWLGGVTLIVLLIACANVANLLLARAFGRKREIAVRLALGVSRARLLTQLIVESLLLAALGGALGIAIAQVGGGVLKSLFMPNYEWQGALVDPRTLAFTVAATLVAGLLAGVAPALHAGRGDLAGALKAGAREGTYQNSRLRLALLVMQGALSVVLLVGAGLFVRSLQNVIRYPLGYDPGQLLFVRTDMRSTRLDSAATVALKRTLRERASQLPGVENVARAMTVPFWQSIDIDVFTPGVDSAGKYGAFQLQAATAEYFGTVGTKIVRGRGIEARDTEHSEKVMVVSEAMAKALWKGEEPLGRCVKINADTMPCRTVVGVAENITRSDFGNDPSLGYYLPIDQYSPRGGGLFVRTRGDAREAAESVRRALQAAMPGDSYVAARAMADVLDPVTRSWRLGATLFVAFGGLALVLATIGLYSVVAYNVAQRMHELGVRVALGAQTGDVLRLVMGQGVGLGAAGLLLGGAVALWGVKFVEPLLFGEAPRDPVVFGVVSATLLAAAVVASAVPAMRATRVDPVTALRSD
jgi:putative ABC transport system permease protein